MTAPAIKQAPPIGKAEGEAAPISPISPISKKEVAVTLSAAEEIAKQKAKRGTPSARIRIGVRGGGCTGFTYVFEWADEVRPTDKEFAGPPLADGSIVSIVVDPKSLVYLGGMELDFVKGMMGHGFKFNNPNAKGACGCGESVQF
ncbi:MAG: iron-sulfur cluster assembly accessory protein [Deltaproteobacteria bacterium]|nr:iron-sulfur cluster assembly accessory protein [Deltaproteobacteria bacterium]